LPSDSKCQLVRFDCEPSIKGLKPGNFSTSACAEKKGCNGAKCHECSRHARARNMVVSVCRVRTKAQDATEGRAMHPNRVPVAVISSGTGTTVCKTVTALMPVMTLTLYRGVQMKSMKPTCILGSSGYLERSNMGA